MIDQHEDVGIDQVPMVVHVCHVEPDLSGPVPKGVEDIKGTLTYRPLVLYKSSWYIFSEFTSFKTEQDNSAVVSRFIASSIT